MYTTIIIVVLAVIALVFAVCKINKEAKTDDIEKEISHIEKKNRKSASGAKGLIMTCDFCGEKFNTLSNNFCPGCGGRIHKEESSIIRNYTAGYSPEPTKTSPEKKFSVPTEIFKSDEKTSSPSPAFIIFIVVCVLISGIGYVVANISTDDYGSSPEDYFNNSGWEMNYEDDTSFTDSGIPEGYFEADYGIPGDNTIYDDGEIRVVATGFYTLDEETAEEEAKTILQYYIENNSNSDVNIQFKYSVSDGGDSFVEFRLSGGESYSGYSFVQPPEITQVEKLVVNYISIYDGDNEEYICNSNDDEDFEPICITTDLYSEAE